MHSRFPLLVALSLTACEPLDAPLAGEAPTVENDRDDLALAAPTPATHAILDECPGASMLGVLDQPGGSCQLAGLLPDGWEATRTFASGSPGVAALSMTVPSELARFCTFEIIDPATADLAELQAAVDAFPGMDLTTLGPDCRGQASQGGGLADPVLGVALRQAFHDNVDRVSAAELAGSESARTPVDIGVVDTVSKAAIENPGIDPANAHGLYMAQIIEDIACPNGATGCASTIHHTLAMPRDDWGTAPDYAVGGQHGTQSDLALAIYEAVAAWQQRYLDDPNTAAPRMAMNLSLGYVRRLDDLEFRARGPARSVITALQYASCQGVLIVAAAGNAPEDACTGEHTGPLAPASLETEVAPTLAECNALGFSPMLDPGTWPVFAPPGAYRPLVYAVGGVNEQDEPLHNTREGGRSRLAALGSNVVAAATPSLDEMITGSSVSAAVVSSEAALVWSYRPQLRPNEVMQLIYDSGYDLGSTADFGLEGQPLHDIHRISVCAALDAACSTPGPCPALECQAQPPAVDGHLGAFFTAVDDVLSDPTNVTQGYLGAVGLAPMCTPVVSNNLHEPQPDLPVCARCNLSVEAAAGSRPDALRLTIEPEYQTSITSVWLYVSDGVSKQEHQLSPEVIESLNSPDVDVTTVWLDAMPGARSASLVFELDLGSEGTPIQEQVIPVER